MSEVPPTLSLICNAVCMELEQPKPPEQICSGLESPEGPAYQGTVSPPQKEGMLRIFALTLHTLKIPSFVLDSTIGKNDTKVQR